MMSGYEIWELVKGPLFAAVLGLGYLGGKVLLRHAIHRLVEYEYDAWAVVAWLGVDLGVLSWSLAIGGRIDARVGFEFAEGVLFFGLLAVCSGCSAFAYSFFVKERRKNGKMSPAKNARLAVTVISSWFFGFLQFVPVVRSLLVPVSQA